MMYKGKYMGAKQELLLYILQNVETGVVKNLVLPLNFDILGV